MTVMRFPSTVGTYNVMTSGAGQLIAALDISIALNGWSKVYDNGSNTVVYQSTDVSTHQRYIQVKDTENYIAEIRGYRFMTDAITGTQSFPNANDTTVLYIVKHDSVFTQPSKRWAVVCDASVFYLWIDPDSNTTPTNPPNAGMYCFGDFVTRKADEIYNTIIIGATGTPAGVAPNRTLSTGFENFHLIANFRSGNFPWYAMQGHYAAGSLMPTGKSPFYNATYRYGIGKHSDVRKPGGSQGTIGTSGIPYPNPMFSATRLSMGPTYLTEAFAYQIGGAVRACLRGTLQGIWSPLHTKPIPHGDVFQGDGLTVSGTREFEAFNLLSGQVMIETSDTWYT